MEIGDQHSEDDRASTVRSERKADLQVEGKLPGYVGFINRDKESQKWSP